MAKRLLQIEVEEAINGPKLAFLFGFGPSCILLQTKKMQHTERIHREEMNASLRRVDAAAVSRYRKYYAAT